MKILESQPGWGATTWLDLAFLALMAVFAWRFLTTGRPAMLRAMEAGTASDHSHH